MVFCLVSLINWIFRKLLLINFTHNVFFTFKSELFVFVLFLTRLLSWRSKLGFSKLGSKNVCGFRYLRSSWAKKENNIKTPEVHAGSGITRLWHTYCRAPNPKNQSVLCARAVVSRIVVAFGKFTLFGPSNPHVTFRVKA